MVFELLGAAFAMSMVKIANDVTGELSLLNLLNTEKALSVIIAIFVSVAIAFVFGTVIQFIARLFFSFNYKKGLGWKIGIFGGLAVTAIVYFLLINGVKGLTIMTAERKQWIDDNTLLIVGVCFVSFTVIMQVLHWLKVNVFKVIVLLGTFALAMAFAGNDLVNFIGVPLAGYDTFMHYTAAGGGDPSSFSVAFLNSSAKTPTLFLIISGAIMVYALATSRKARNVIKTSVDLSKQESGDEMFGSSRVARSLVRNTVNVFNSVLKVIPAGVRQWVDKRMNSDDVILEKGAAFDMVRASVSLVLAGALIALGTSLTLPLSTTYVTFMVAMGTSLADRAWGRESAVYRITGVITVILGWFVTAFVAFLISFVVAAALVKGGVFAIIILCLLCIYLIIHSNRLSRKKRLAKEKEDALKTAPEGTVVERCIHDVINSTKKIIEIYNRTLDGVFKEDRRELKKMLQEARELHESASDRKYNIVATLNLLKESNIETAHYYVQVVDYLNEITKSMLQICKSTFVHIDNNHEGLSIEQMDDLKYVNARMNEVFERVDAMLVSNDFTDIDKVIEMRDKIFEDFAIAIKNQIKRNTENKNTTRSSVLYLNILTEDKIMILQMRNMLKAQKYFVENESKAL